MTISNWKLPRRHFLKGIGGAMAAVPYLEAMGSTKKPSDAPKRACFVYFPNGASLPPKNHSERDTYHWFPLKKEDGGLHFTKSIAPLKGNFSEYTILGGLSHPLSRSLLGHAAGDTWLTAGDIRRDYQNSISIDQVIANEFGKKVRFPYLTLSVDGGVGYKSRASSLSFNHEGKTIPTQHNLRYIFETLFSSGSEGSKESQRKNLLQQQKIVDFLLEDAKRLSSKLGSQDQKKLGEYLSSVSEVEDRIIRTEKWLDVPKKKVNATASQFDVDPRLPEEYVRAMYDLIVLALQTDSTRVISYMISREDGMGKGDNFPKILFGTGGHHKLQHDKGKMSYSNWGQYDNWLSTQFNYFIDKLKNTHDEHGRIIDSTMVLYGSCQSTTHNARNYPLILAGGKDMRLKHGRFLEYSDDIPMANLFNSMSRGLGLDVKPFRDSTGHIENIFQA